MDSPVGHLLIEADEQGLTALDRTDKPLSPPDTPLLTEAVHQLSAYFNGTLTDFDLPLHMTGTPFQLRCWQALRTIPYGETISYGEQARRIGSPRATRAVGGANHRNPISIVVPCHRVIGADGSLTGYGGGLGMKRWLLEHEQKHTGT
ncbi:MAG: methylated-DNA--[protein]-cysteine S-methyltransferase [Clostridiales bacterium]|nr:methylated-DNA--[protein]-cysteine S-methyltransferase [Clostridiales bacterium]